MTAPRSVPDLVERLAERDATATLLVDATPGGLVPVTRGEVWDRSLALAEELERRRVGAGDAVGVWLPNWSDAVCWQVAAGLLGAHVVGVNTRYNVSEVAHTLERSTPSVLAVAAGFHGLDLLFRLRQAQAHRTGPPPSVAVITGPGAQAEEPGPDADVGAGAWAPRLVTDGGPAHRSARAGGGELAVAFTTSGSTGLPKLAAHTGEAVAGHAVAAATASGVGPGDMVLGALPLSGAFGFAALMAAVGGGGACLLEPVFDEDLVVDDMAAAGVTHVVAGDDMAVRLLAAWTRRPRPLPAWRWLGMADFQGRFHDVATWATEELGVHATGVYGSSEVFALASMWAPDEIQERRWQAGGRLVAPGMEVRAVDPGTGAPVKPGEEGELQFRGPAVVDAYLGDPDARRRSVGADGWLSSGDLGACAEAGVLVYRCRIGDALRLRGFLVHPTEIEERLVDHPAVAQAKVVGVADGDEGTRVVGFVVLADAAVVTGDDLRRWCAEALAGFKVPADVRILDRMPTTSGVNGTKIKASVLREWAKDPADGPA